MGSWEGEGEVMLLGVREVGKAGAEERVDGGGGGGEREREGDRREGRESRDEECTGHWGSRDSPLRSFSHSLYRYST